MELTIMTQRIGFGERTEQNEKSGTWQYENGHIEISDQAMKHAMAAYPGEGLAGAVGLALAVEVGGVDLAEYAEASADVDYDALHNSLTDIEGVGDSTADEIMETVQEGL